MVSCMENELGGGHGETDSVRREPCGEREHEHDDGEREGVEQ